MLEINVVGTDFIFKSDKLKFINSLDNKNEISIIMDTFLNLHNIHLMKSKFKLAWLLEPPCIWQNSYNIIKEHSHLFDLILTHDSFILKNFKNSHKFEFGLTWIKNKKIYNKNKLCSIIVSEKRCSSGHILRYDILNLLQNTNFIDKFGRSVNNYIKEKEDTLKDYMFSITIENQKSDNYFTEKILDCFKTGTIPIYWGCPNISNYFDMNGIIVFNTIPELIEILNNLSPELYYSKLENAKRNFELSKKWESWDTRIIDIFKNYNFI